MHFFHRSSLSPGCSDGGSSHDHEEPWSEGTASSVPTSPCGGLEDRDSSIGGWDYEDDDGPIEENSSPGV